MRVRVVVAILILWGTVQGITPGAGRYPDTSHPLVRGLFGLGARQYDLSQTQDSLSDIDVNSPYYRYPGRAMMMSLVVPGAGQLYVGRPMRTVVFMGVEILVLLAWNSYAQRGEDMTQAFRDFADDYWDFNRWLDTTQYQIDPWGRGEGRIYVGTYGSHHLNYFVNLEGGSKVFGNTKDDAKEFIQYLNNPSTEDSVYIIKNHEYYENVGKYNQFFSGWDDATLDAEIDTTRKSGPIALSEHRSKYLDMRGDANRLKSVASYAISALMFNHVISAIDAIFATSRWNREHASRLSGRLWFNPAYSHGVSGVQISLAW